MTKLLINDYNYFVKVASLVQQPSQIAEQCELVIAKVKIFVCQVLIELN